MFASILFTTIAFLTVSVHNTVAADFPHLEGFYNMHIPGDGNQYVFNIDWSHSLNRYLVTVTGQSLAWATATLNIVNDTSVNLVCDNGAILPGTINYPTDLPSICWPMHKDFTCWNRLLSNITRIHVINM
jgi:hypothetical protein